MTHAVGSLVMFDVEWRGETHKSVWRVVAVERDDIIVRHCGGLLYTDRVRLLRERGVGYGVLESV